MSLEETSQATSLIDTARGIGTGLFRLAPAAVQSAGSLAARAFDNLLLPQPVEEAELAERMGPLPYSVALVPEVDLRGTERYRSTSLSSVYHALSNGKILHSELGAVGLYTIASEADGDEDVEGLANTAEALAGHLRKIRPVMLSQPDIAFVNPDDPIILPDSAVRADKPLPIYTAIHDTISNFRNGVEVVASERKGEQVEVDPKNLAHVFVASKQIIEALAGPHPKRDVVDSFVATDRFARDYEWQAHPMPSMASNGPGLKPAEQPRLSDDHVPRNRITGGARRRELVAVTDSHQNESDPKA